MVNDGLSLAVTVDFNARKIVQQWNYPILLIKASCCQNNGSVFDTPNPGISISDTDSFKKSGEELEDYIDPASVILPLCKSNRNSFSYMITVGRAANNDICFSDMTLSKLHGWFLPPEKMEASGSI